MSTVVLDLTTHLHLIICVDVMELKKISVHLRGTCKHHSYDIRVLIAKNACPKYKYIWLRRVYILHNGHQEPSRVLIYLGRGPSLCSTLFHLWTSVPQILTYSTVNFPWSSWTIDLICDQHKFAIGWIPDKKKAPLCQIPRDTGTYRHF